MNSRQSLSFERRIPHNDEVKLILSRSVLYHRLPIVKSLQGLVRLPYNDLLEKLWGEDSKGALGLSFSHLGLANGLLDKKQLAFNV